MNVAITKLINIAQQEAGYLEKASNSQLDSKTGNAGNNNYTKYANDLYPSLQGQAWCDMFVDWCFVQAFGQVSAKQLLGGFSAYTPISAQYFKNKKQYHSTPQPGDQIFFKNSTRICHTGIVTGVSSTKVYTIEGNTSSATAVVANGGGVFEKSYSLTNTAIDGYGRPDWSIVEKPSYVPNKWVHDTNGWWYPYSASEYYKSCWAIINRHKYYFNQDGYALRGWQVLPHPENKEECDFYFEPRSGHQLECALYVSDEYGIQKVGYFN